MKTNFYSLYSKTLSFCLLLLGFSSCDDPVDEYGTPSARYKVSGKVVSGDTDKAAIPDIQVVMIEQIPDQPNENYFRGDTVKTNKQGEFTINSERFPYSGFKIKLQDIDGSTNGKFEDKEIIIDLKDSDYSKGSNWYKGEAKKDIGTIELIPKEKE